MSLRASEDGFHSIESMLGEALDILIDGGTGIFSIARIHSFSFGKDGCSATSSIQSSSHIAMSSSSESSLLELKLLLSSSELTEA